MFPVVLFPIFTSGLLKSERKLRVKFSPLMKLKVSDGAFFLLIRYKGAFLLCLYEITAYDNFLSLSFIMF